MSRSIIGRQLAAARTLLNKRQSDVAQSIGLSLPTLKRMEAGETAIPGLPGNVALVVDYYRRRDIVFQNDEGRRGVILAHLPATSESR